MMAVSIRALSEKDIHRLATIADDKKVADTLRDYFPHPYSQSDAEEYIKFVTSQDPTVNFGIIYNDLLVGICGGIPMSDIHSHCLELGYWLGSDYWGKGIASKAVKLLIDYYFGQKRYSRLHAITFSNNPASQRVLTKNGFQQEGLLREYVYKNGEMLDAPTFSLLKREWKQANALQ